MPTVEQIALIICTTADVMATKEFEQRYACSDPQKCEDCMARARQIMKLFSEITPSKKEAMK